jgi:transposase
MRPRIAADWPVPDLAGYQGALRQLLAQLWLEFDHLQTRIEEADAVIKKTARENEARQRLVPIPGSGPMATAAIIAAIGSERGIMLRAAFACHIVPKPASGTFGTERSRR